MSQPAVIKTDAPGRGVSLAGVFSLEDIARQAERMLAAAQDKGRRLLADAKRQADLQAAAAGRQGYDAGYAEGLAAGRTDGHQQALAEAGERFQAESASLVQALASLLAELEAAKNRVIADAERDQLALAHALAEKVTRLRVQLDCEAAKANLDAAVRYVAGRSNVVVCVNPADLEAARTFAAELVKTLENLETLDVQADEAVSRGGCLVQYGAGRIDATVETQLALVARQLLGAAEEEHGAVRPV